MGGQPLEHIAAGRLAPNQPCKSAATPGLRTHSNQGILVILREALLSCATDPGARYEDRTEPKWRYTCAPDRRKLARLLRKTTDKYDATRRGSFLTVEVICEAGMMK